PALNYLSMEDAIAHCTRGLGIWDWASTDEGRDPDVVLACAGDVPTLETLAAADLIRQHLPQVAVRFVNVVDLMRLQPPTEHPHGLRDAEFDEVFTTDKPVIFAYHGYPWLIHRLTYRRTNHPNIHVLNAGSSSVKLSLVDGDDRILFDREFEVSEGRLDEAQLANAIHGVDGVEAIGHRIVHGGPRYQASVRIDGDVIRYLISITDL